jgi:hypothetical protein
VPLRISEPSPQGPLDAAALESTLAKFWRRVSGYPEKAREGCEITQNEAGPVSTFFYVADGQAGDGSWLRVQQSGHVVELLNYSDSGYRMPGGRYALVCFTDPPTTPGVGDLPAGVSYLRPGERIECKRRFDWFYVYAGGVDSDNAAYFRVWHDRYARHDSTRATLENNRPMNCAGPNWTIHFTGSAVNPAANYLFCQSMAGLNGWWEWQAQVHCSRTLAVGVAAYVERIYNGSQSGVWWLPLDGSLVTVGPLLMTSGVNDRMNIYNGSVAVTSGDSLRATLHGRQVG